MEKQPPVRLLFIVTLAGQGWWPWLRAHGPLCPGAQGLPLGCLPAAAGAPGAGVGLGAAPPPRVPGCTSCLRPGGHRCLQGPGSVTPRPSPSPAGPGTEATFLSELLDLLPDHGSRYACALLQRALTPDTLSGVGTGAPVPPRQLLPRVLPPVRGACLHQRGPAAEAPPGGVHTRRPPEGQDAEVQFLVCGSPSRGGIRASARSLLLFRIFCGSRHVLGLFSYFWDKCPWNFDRKRLESVARFG